MSKFLHPEKESQPVEAEGNFQPFRPYSVDKRTETFPARTRGTTAPSVSAGVRVHRAPPHNLRRKRAKENCMDTSRTRAHRTTLRTRRLIACAAALTLTASISRAPLAHADDAHDVVPPAVPANLQVPAGNTAFLVGHADGTQDYICMPCPNAITTRRRAQAPASRGPSSGHRPRCSTTMTSKSSPTSSAPTRPHRAEISGSRAPRGRTPRTPAPSGRRR